MGIKEICIIGAGISGLVTAKTLLEEGYEITVFEKQKHLGGVWEKGRVYPGLTTQSGRNTYHFSDYPFPEDYPEFPTAEHIRKYLESYARDFDLTNKIFFQTEVVNVLKRTQEKGWVVDVRDNVREKDIVDRQPQENRYNFDFVVICNGVFNTPRIPKIEGEQEFISSGGQILHSSQFIDLEQIANKKLLVVGFGKSAVEIATIAIGKVRECHLIYRRALWKIPKYFLNKIHYEKLLMTRFSEIWQNYLNPVGIEKFLHSLGQPLVWGFWRVNELIIKQQFSLKACGLIPDQPIEKTLNCTANLAPDNFYPYVKQGKIKVRKTEIVKFIPNGIKLASGEDLSADVVIFGTGFRQNVAFLEEKSRQLLMDHEGHFHLYRHIMHPDVPDLAFIGYNSSFFCQLTSEVASWWLAEYIKGNLALPTKSHIYKQMDTHFYWTRKNTPPGSAYGTCVSPFGLHHLEELIEDMGFQVYGKGSKQLQGKMDVVNPSAYQPIRQQLRNQKRSLSKTQPQNVN